MCWRSTKPRRRSSVKGEKKSRVSDGGSIMAIMWAMHYSLSRLMEGHEARLSTVRAGLWWDGSTKVTTASLITALPSVEGAMVKRRRLLGKSRKTTQINVVFSSSRAASPVRWRQLCPDCSVGFFFGNFTGGSWFFNASQPCLMPTFSPVFAEKLTDQEKLIRHTNRGAQSSTSAD